MSRFIPRFARSPAGGRQKAKPALTLPIVKYGLPLAALLAVAGAVMVALAMPPKEPPEPVTLATPPPACRPLIEQNAVLNTQKASIIFPVVSNLPEERVQAAVNSRLERVFGLDDMLAFARDMERESQNGRWQLDFGFNAEIIGNVLHLRGLRYTYTGGAHGDNEKSDAYIDCRTGEFYSMSQLFRSHEIADAVIGEFIDKEIAKRPGDYNPDAKALPLPALYTFTPDGLCVEYPPYAIAPYARGFVSFLLPKEMILSLINGTGDFYRALLAE